mmetsp:Transcript_20383/g.31169  ORF Transcript_20383/g.31169 Transcript_20383/m.31169 type:complete len:85 (+) Transcript_20383:2639-2893(+)
MAASATGVGQQNIISELLLLMHTIMRDRNSSSFIGCNRNGSQHASCQKQGKHKPTTHDDDDDSSEMLRCSLLPQGHTRSRFKNV